MDDASFSEILGAARAGEASAWEQVYRDLAPRVLGYLRARHAADPEDLLGEIFLHVVRDLPRFSGGEGDFRSWVFTIAHHRLVDAARTRSRRVALASTPVDDMPGDIPGGDVESEALRAISDETVRRALRELTSDQRAVLLLRIFGDLSLREVADALDKPVGAVKSLQHRATEAIRRSMAGHPYLPESSERSSG